VNYSDVKKVTFLGIGGKGAFYIAKYFLLLGTEVQGFDLKKSQRTEELEKLGAQINYNNPKEDDTLDGDFVVYSNDLPQKIQKEIKERYSDKDFLEVGSLYHQVLRDFEDDSMSIQEKDIFNKSEIAPLYSIDTSKMKYIGITGTDGKTTSCTMVYHLLKDHGFKPALITTVSAKIGEEEIDVGLHTTTPTSQELYDLIKKAEEADCTHIIIESTSHGLEQGRLAGLQFDIVGYTNISNEHLDYHKSWEGYVEAKSRLITDHLKEDGEVILNMDDRSYSKLRNLNPDHLTYSIENNADIFAKEIKESIDGLKFDTQYLEKKIEVFLPILGKYNVSNFLLASLIAEKLGVSLEKCSEYIKSFETVQGRMEVVQKDPFYVIVDYAHTPNAIKNALESARELQKNGKLIHVFGCAGHRDFYKRPEMGKISNELADVTILTAEDPRMEILSEINDSIEEGWRENDNGRKELIRFDDVSENVENRRDAIRKALEIANPGDIVIITGKAHEMSLCFGQEEYPWNDIEETEKLLSSNL
jgi:UDP-N-acetylmuramoyl-L-alanyl-D-glutamate--2,6-diaminopimelate ligase